MHRKKDFEGESNKSTGLSYLKGRIEYGDSIEDEWVVVWLLRELSRKFPNLWVKLSDSDGEFLLIEASGTLPAWLEPEVADNRVWINDGHLKIIKPAGKSRSSKRTEERLTLQEAREIILTDQKRIMHSASMEEEAFYRLRNYPEQIKDNMHHAILRLPRKVAYLLLQKPAYIAPAIEAFYLRDPISLKPLRAKDAMDKLIFPPKDLIEMSIRFPRVGYAQVKSQDFPVPDVWKGQMPSPQDPAHPRAETGMKLTCGFEMLLSDTHHQDLSSVREMKLLLEDIDSGDTSLPTDVELSMVPMPSDDEAWLNINFEDLQAELNRSNKDIGNKKAEFGHKAAQENLQRIVKQFESFLNDDQNEDASGLFQEGDSDTDDLNDIDSDDLGEDKDASFDDDEFTKMMQEMMGMPPEVMKEIMKGKIDALDNGALPAAPVVPESTGRRRETDEELSSDEEEEDDAELHDIMRRMGEELKASGALDLGNATTGSSSTKQAITSGEQSGVVQELNSSDDDVADGFDERFAKNLLESFRSQGGGTGPASNLMAMMAESSAAGSKNKGKDHD